MNFVAKNNIICDHLWFATCEDILTVTALERKETTGKGQKHMKYLNTSTLVSRNWSLSAFPLLQTAHGLLPRCPVWSSSWATSCWRLCCPHWEQRGPGWRGRRTTLLKPGCTLCTPPRALSLSPSLPPASADLKENRQQWGKSVGKARLNVSQVEQSVFYGV